MIYYASFRLVSESHELHPTLRAIVDELSLAAARAGWDKVVVTSIFRTIAENRAAKATTLVHCQKPHRAIDLRIRGIAPAVVEAVGQELNRGWEYDRLQPRLNVALWKLHGNGPHLHIQAHRNTRRRLA